RGFDKLFLSQTIEQLERFILDVYPEIEKDRTKVEEKTADLLDSYFTPDNAVSLVKTTLADLGFEVDSLPVHLEAQTVGNVATTHTINPNDIRIVASLKHGLHSIRALIHEFGHALYHHYILQPHVSSHGIERCLDEGVADIFKDITTKPQWLREYASVPKNLIEKAGHLGREREARQLRWDLAQVYFEKEMYTHPYQNIAHLFQNVYKRYGIPLERDGLDFAKYIEHFTINPVCSIDYLIASLIKDQTIHHFESCYGDMIHNPQLKPFLQENYFKHGASQPWSELVYNATGEPLNPHHTIERLKKS
ncbi:hypothetical protein MYX07_06705, partial [Patescibacteria group bacterium AH-259-L07]|nr:hypothetical protein [Patescibacteria group bacterium AH-259-L07]